MQSVKDMKLKMKELHDKHIPIYSYSKLTTWEYCKYNYYESYILHKRGKDNIYSEIGTVVHDGLEDLYNNKCALQDIENNFNTKILECSKKGIKFPDNPPTIKINYMKNMKHFFNNYKIMNTKMKTEYFILYNIPRIDNPTKDEDYIWIQMKIDSIIPVLNDDGEFESVIVNDWKTSSKFTKDKKVSAGKQLLLYKLGVEQAIGVNVSKIGWTMLKFVYCNYMTKGSKSNSPKLKQSMQERKDCIKYFHNKIVSDFIEMGMDNFDAEMKANEAINKNDLSVLPQEIQDKYAIEDCFLEYEFDDEVMEDCIQWVKNVVNDIESVSKKENDYPNIPINDSTNFFCFNLCGRPDCKHLMKYKYDNKDNFKKEQKAKSLESIFGQDKENKEKILMDLDRLFC